MDMTANLFWNFLESSLFARFLLIVQILTICAIALNIYEYKKMTSAKKTKFKLAFKPLLGLFLSPVILCSIPIFIIYKYIVHCILKNKYGSKYDGIIDGRDSVYNLENENPACLLMILQYKEKGGVSFYDRYRYLAYKELVLKGKVHPKVFGSIKMCMGYSYLSKDQLTFDDCFKKLKTRDIKSEELTKDELLEIIESYTETPLPKNREAFWEAYLGTQPVKWTKKPNNDGMKCYPVLFRINHTLADAKHIIFGLCDLFGDTKEIRMGCATINLTTIYENARTTFFSMNAWKRLAFHITYYIRFLYAVCLSPAVGFVNSLLMENECNALHGPNPTYKKFMFFNTDEGESRNYVHVAKRIKQKIPNCTFADVFLTAIAANFREYYEKNSTSIPEYILTEAPILPPFDLADLLEPEERLHCRNRLSMNVRKLPVKVDFEHTATPLINLLQLIKQEGTYIRYSMEHEVNYFFLRVVCNFIPAPLLRLIIELFHNCTTLISNVPGPYAMSFGGCNIMDVIAWTATRGRTGIGIAIFTYDERLQLSLIVDKAICTDRKKIQCLLDGVYKYLDKLDAEVRDHL